MSWLIDDVSLWFQWQMMQSDVICLEGCRAKLTHDKCLVA